MLKKKLTIFISIFVLLVTLIALVLYRSQTSSPITTLHISGSIVAMSKEELMEESSLVCYGKIVNISDPFEIISVTGGKSTFTDYYLEITEVLRGDASVLDTKTVRMQGGKIDDLLVFVDYNPTLELGNNYLLFLYQPGTGGGFNTEGDYYYVNGCHQGAFEDKNDLSDQFTITKRSTLTDQLKNENVELVVESEYGNELEITELQNEMVEFNKKHPVDSDFQRDSLKKGLKANLDSQFMPIDEYNQAIEQMDQYATIVK